MNSFVSPPGKQIPGILIFGFVPKGGKQNRTKGQGEGRSHIEDLAFRNRPWREPGRLGRRAPIEHGPFR
ncbi:MAG: hypothetical protein B5M54_08925, partial [Candidatus Aminicenantes bacterium 4484_214]